MKEIFCEANAAFNLFQDAYRIECQSERTIEAQVGTPKHLRRWHPFIYARSFLFSLDYFQCLLGQIAQDDRSPASVKAVSEKLNVLIPDVRHVRNSAHHIEQRIEGLHHKSPIHTKPIDNEFIYAPQGGMIIGSLMMDRLSYTMQNGEVGGVSVNEETMLFFAEIYQELLYSFEWYGPKLSIDYSLIEPA
ncbi:hypothetical protein [Pseudomonas lactucae]|uniref:hypothetical protein n=1 Tax=Pseudomonas lactucae TaxID=2813360 RepID=UPI002FCD0EA6